MNNLPALLHEPINNQRFTQDFKQLSARMDLRTLADIIATPEPILFGHPHFTYTWLRELVVFLQAHGCLDLLERPQRP
jgi:hypothetical protein